MKNKILLAAAFLIVLIKAEGETVAVSHIRQTNRPFALFDHCRQKDLCEKDCQKLGGRLLDNFCLPLNFDSDQNNCACRLTNNGFCLPQGFCSKSFNQTCSSDLECQSKSCSLTTSVCESDNKKK
jgi:hypothetical protein